MCIRRTYLHQLSAAQQLANASLGEARGVYLGENVVSEKEYRSAMMRALTAAYGQGRKQRGATERGIADRAGWRRDRGVVGALGATAALRGELA
jgi:hypothetical protein